MIQKCYLIDFTSSFLQQTEQVYLHGWPWERKYLAHPAKLMRLLDLAWVTGLENCVRDSVCIPWQGKYTSSTLGRRTGIKQWKCSLYVLPSCFPVPPLMSSLSFQGTTLQRIPGDEPHLENVTGILHHCPAMLLLLGWSGKYTVLRPLSCWCEHDWKLWLVQSGWNSSLDVKSLPEICLMGGM